MSRRERTAGGGRVGFVIALVVVGYAGLAGWSFLPVRIAHYELEEKVKEILKFRGTAAYVDCRELRSRVHREARKAKIPLEMEDITCKHNKKDWRITVSYEREFSVPGYSKVIEWEIDETFTDY